MAPSGAAMTTFFADETLEVENREAKLRRKQRTCRPETPDFEDRRSSELDGRVEREVLEEEGKCACRRPGTPDFEDLRRSELDGRVEREVLEEEGKCRSGRNEHFLRGGVDGMVVEEVVELPHARGFEWIGGVAEKEGV